MTFPKRLVLACCLLALALVAWPVATGTRHPPVEAAASTLAVGTAAAERVSRGARRVLRGLSFGIQELGSLLGVDPRGSRETPDQKRSRRRHARIQKELAALGTHPTAGVYRHGFSELVVAPGAGFAVHVGSWCGTGSGWVASGSVSTGADPSRWTLTPDPEALQVRSHFDDPSWWDRESVLHFLHWGEFQFAVPAAELASFYSQAHDGTSFPEFPFRYTSSMQRPSLFEDPPRPEGLPAVVPGLEHLLLEQAVTSRIVALDTRHPGLPGAEDAVFLIGSGASSGLVAGMHMYVADLDPQRYRATLLHVGNDTSHLELGDLDPTLTDTLVGRTVSTRR